MPSDLPSLNPTLMSSKGTEGTDALASVPSKIRTIWASSEHADIVSRLRNAPLGQLYRNRLKQFTLVRGVARWIWWNLFPLYIRLSVWMKKRYPLVALKEYASEMGVEIHKLSSADVIETSRPKVFPVVDRDYIHATQGQYSFPEVYVATIKRGTVMGGTNLCLADDKVVCHDLYDCERDMMAEEIHGRALIYPRSRCVTLVYRDKNPHSVPTAATFVDACAPNYAHWMTEVLPRVILFCQEDRFKGIPIVVNEGLHPNIMESLKLVVGMDREIIRLPVGRALFVEELYVTSVAGYVPFERRNKDDDGHSHGSFSTKAFDLLRARLETVTQETAAGSWPERVYLRRNSGVRRILNEDKIEKLLKDRGFVVVEPETLTFAQQVQCFSHARVIVGPTGAGFANAIFCEKGTQVAILISKHRDLAYKYWVNMFAPIGINFNYVLGNIADNYEYGVHGDFEINESSLKELLEDLPLS